MGDAPPASELAPLVGAWFRANARPLPWRPDPIDGLRDPYRALVSELMLQQTQVARVIDRYTSFLERFPNVRALASAPESDVLAEWSGLGYYRRARLLHAAARAIVDRHDGEFPEGTDAIRALPGVGAYTAGAIASMVFKRKEPLLDGNVERVLLRLACKDDPPKDKATQAWAWDQARALVEASEDPGVLNEGLMELGATVCTPSAPKCPACPLRAQCGARAAGRTEEIPTPKPRARQKAMHAVCFVVADSRGRLLVQTRPDGGMWAGMAQPPSVESDRPIDPDWAAGDLGLEAGEHLGSFEHVTTHRRVAFEVYEGHALKGVKKDGAWVPPRELAAMGLSNAHRRAFGMWLHARAHDAAPLFSKR